MNAVQMACSTTGTNSDIDVAFDSISDLLRANSKEDFALSIEGWVTFSFPFFSFPSSYSI